MHAAWPVNFNIGLASFRPQLAGLRRLLDLAADVPFQKPARLLFTGSISAAFRMPAGSTVPEGPLAGLAYAAPTGYARSKLVGERICERAAAAAAATVNDKGKLPAISINGDGDGDAFPHVAVIRVGQISADTEHGIWNEKEAIPLLVRGGAQVGALPRLGGRCKWMPVDTAARAITELASRMKPGSSSPHPNGVKGKESHVENGVARENSSDNGSVAKASSSSSSSSSAALFYNLLAPHHFSWNEDFLPAARASGLLRFDEVALSEWLTRLRAWADELGDEAEARLPAIKLAEYYATAYAEKKEDVANGAKTSSSSAELTWDVGRACAHSESVRTCPRVVNGVLVDKMVRHWLEADGTLESGP